MPPRDRYAAQADTVTQQGRRLMKIVKSDIADLPEIPKALLCTVAGNIAITSQGGDVDTDGETDLGAAVIVPIGAGDVYDATRVKRLWSTGTTATVFGILG